MLLASAWEKFRHLISFFLVIVTFALQGYADIAWSKLLGYSGHPNYRYLNIDQLTSLSNNLMSKTGCTQTSHLWSFGSSLVSLWCDLSCDSKCIQQKGRLNLNVVGLALLHETLDSCRKIQ